MGRGGRAWWHRLSSLWKPLAPSPRDYSLPNSAKRGNRQSGRGRGKARPVDIWDDSRALATACPRGWLLKMTYDLRRLLQESPGPGRSDPANFFRGIQVIVPGLACHPESQTTFPGGGLWARENSPRGPVAQVVSAQSTGTPGAGQHCRSPGRSWVRKS